MYELISAFATQKFCSCGEAGNTTVIGTQLYFTLVRQRYKHGGHIERAFERERKTCFVPFPNSDVSNDENKLQ